jgi:hypothetical protein
MRFFVFIAACLMPVTVFAAQQKPEMVPCSQIKASPVYAAYGLSTPEGWKCAAPVKNSKLPPAVFYWQKDNKRIYFFSDGFHQPVSKEDEKNLPGLASLKEPQRAIRLDAECLVGQSKQYENAPGYKDLTKECAQKPRGLLSSRDRKQVVFYTDEGMVEHRGKKVALFDALIYKKDDSRNVLNAACYGCNAEEFFSYVINPVIQK